ncbi:hypothetical protein AVEN_28604-1 [Araneus ventricosus]|uniref:Uncharacterized protein n=1 Tax=Araneus ventricosus TaxID=182803 RepID=A0A4Y2DDY4_ARAVE|nr:hypothetical protein AVEN_28604-1 [Araneus ventricosus]
MKAMSSHHHHQQYTLHFLAWKIESHMEDKFLPIERQLQCTQMAQKINDQTGSAFCVIANEAITKTWKAKLSPANTVFQAAIEWANTANEDVSINSLASKLLNPLM